MLKNHISTQLIVVIFVTCLVLVPVFIAEPVAAKWSTHFANVALKPNPVTTDGTVTVTGNLQVWNPTRGWIGLNGFDVEIVRLINDVQWVVLATTKSGPSDGSFSCSVTAPSSAGTYQIGAHFAGDDLDNPSTANWVSLTVQQGTGNSRLKNVLMFYMCGDNELGPGIVGALNYMSAAGGSTNDVTIIAMCDFLDTANDGIWYITGSGSFPTGDVRLWTSASELDMGDPTNLAFFINYVSNNFPADRYIMTIWGHGGGWMGVSYDAHPGSKLSIPALGATIAASGMHFDLLQFEACMMDMAEVGYQLRHSVNVMVASEEADYMSRPYTNIVQWLKANPQRSAADLGAQIVNGYFTIANPGRGTLAAVDLTLMPAVAIAMDNLGNLLIARMPAWQSRILAASSATQRYEWTDYADIFDFTNKLDAQISDTQLQTATAAVRTAVGQAALTEQHKGADLHNSHGLSTWIFGGSSSGATFVNLLQGYRALQFTTDTSWDEFNVELLS